MASSSLLPFRTLADLPARLLARFARPMFIRRCREEGFDEWSTQAFVEQIREVSLALEALGVGPGDRVALMSESRPEWLIADFAILTGGAVTVPIYPTLPPQQASYILNDAGVRIAFVSDRAQLEKLQSIRHSVPQLAVIIVIDETLPPLPPGTPAPPRDASVVTLAEMGTRGKAIVAADLQALVRYEARRAAIAPDDLATIIYTSGTTGEPKGVMLSHRNVVSNVVGSCAMMPKGPDDAALSFLPLSHAFERTCVYSHLEDGVVVNFAESIDSLGRDLPRVAPSIMTGVPRVYEKLYARIFERAMGSAAPRRWIFTWGVGVGMQRMRKEQANGGLPVTWTWQDKLADRLVFSTIRERTGGRLRCIVSGSAPLNVEVAGFFAAIGLPIMEGYGLTETSPVLTVNPRECIRIGTVGVRLPDVELRIAEDGEILARGPNVMQGYWQKTHATHAVIQDGWFHTGDIGTLSPDGYLSITDRKKDLIVTSGGKKVAPQPLEARLKTNPLVAEAIVIGDRRRYPAVLFVPDFKILEQRLAALGRPLASREALVGRDDVIGLYQEIVSALNRDLAQFEQLKRIALIPAEFSIATGELTPTLKVRRPIVEERWKSVIEEMYSREK